jgi:hypothetical protein
VHFLATKRVCGRKKEPDAYRFGIDHGGDQQPSRDRRKSQPPSDFLISNPFGSV